MGVCEVTRPMLNFGAPIHYTGATEVGGWADGRTDGRTDGWKERKERGKGGRKK